MKLQTKIQLRPQTHNQIDYNSNILLLGSCFSENISAKFGYHKLKSIVNPFGILFHPVAIENLVTRAINKSYYSEEDFYLSHEQYCCLDVHSKFNSSSKQDLLTHLNSEIEKTHEQLKTLSHVIITLGTSWVYRHIASDVIVANCHKLSQKQFVKELLSVTQISESLDATISLIKSVNPKATILFTTSPVRHLEDGFIENTRSKSQLQIAMHNVVDPREHIHYFPSYEIMMDELRDYRFYNVDMLHPNLLAVDYIWEKFKSVWLSEDALKTSQIVASIQAKKAHVPFNAASAEHQQFLTKLQSEIKDLCAKYPNISF